MAQSAVLCIRYSAPCDAVSSEARDCPPIDCVVCHSRQQIVRRLHRVEVTSEMQVDFLRRLDRRHTAAGTTTFVAEDWTE